MFRSLLVLYDSVASNAGRERAREGRREGMGEDGEEGRREGERGAPQ